MIKHKRIDFFYTFSNTVFWKWRNLKGRKRVMKDFELGDKVFENAMVLNQIH